MMKLLIIGHKGQLGFELVKQAPKAGFEYDAVDLPEIDITNKAQINELIEKSKPSLVVNAAAYTAVDKAETEAELAFKVNRDGAGNIAKACAEANNIPLIHISTDYVFDGQKASPYFENDPVCPIGIYGKSKEEGERAVRAALGKHIIIRTAWLYGVHGHNFVKTMLKLGQEREVLRVVADQRGCPTSAADLAEAILSVAMQSLLVASPNWGTYHYCGQGITTWHEFTEKILELAKLYTEIKTRKVEAITTAEYPTPAKRPMYSALDCSKIAKNFNIIPKPWQKSLKTVIDEIQTRKA
jgi:dTDP-4-dehydrorhamnose reductase